MTWAMTSPGPICRSQRGQLQKRQAIHMYLSRREVIRRLAVLGAAGVVSRHAQAAEPHLDFPQRAQDRLSVTSYPFRAYIDAPGNTERDRTKPGMDLKDFGATVAKKF